MGQLYVLHSLDDGSSMSHAPSIPPLGTGHLHFPPHLHPHTYPVPDFLVCIPGEDFIHSFIHACMHTYYPMTLPIYETDQKQL